MITRNAGNRRSITIASALLMCVASLAGITAQSAGGRAFATPEDAVKALVDTVKASDLDALRAIFGPDGRDLSESSDPATARLNRRVFSVAFKEQWHLEDATGGRKTLVIGNENWPFPVPLVKSADGWRFDAAAGKEEVLARRIGRNELNAIAASRAYVTAQHRYAQHGHDGKPAGIYATKFASDTGKQNGLYWPAAHGQPRSPLGDLVARAAEDGVKLGGDRPALEPFHGYYFRILTGQGAGASGGARSYIVRGEMSGGFALIAWPAQYDASGVMTFMVNQSGTVLERDLGPQTDAIVRKITAYQPDANWKPVE